MDDQQQGKGGGFGLGKDRQGKDYCRKKLREQNGSACAAVACGEGVAGPQMQPDRQQEEEGGQAGGALHEVGDGLGLQGMGDEEQGAEQGESALREPAAKQQVDQAAAGGADGGVGQMERRERPAAQTEIYGKGQVGDAARVKIRSRLAGRSRST